MHGQRCDFRVLPLILLYKGPKWSPLADCDSSTTYTVWYSTSSGTIELPSGASNEIEITGTSTILTQVTMYIWVTAVSSDGPQGKFSIRMSGLPYNGKFV